MSRWKWVQRKVKMKIKSRNRNVIKRSSVVINAKRSDVLMVRI